MAYSICRRILNRDLADLVGEYLGVESSDIRFERLQLHDEIVYDSDQFDVTFPDFCRERGIIGWVSVMPMYWDFYDLMFDMALLIVDWDEDAGELSGTQACRQLSERLLDQAELMDAKMSHESGPVDFLKWRSTPRGTYFHDSRSIMMDWYQICMRNIIDSILAFP